MKKLTLLSVFVLFLVSCNNQPKKNATDTAKETEATEVVDAKFGRQNYAVVWNWLATDKDVFESAMLTVSEEMQELWEEDVLSDSYFNNTAKVEDIKIFPNISCFVKAKSEEEAKEILDGLTLVKLGLAEYMMFPVGTKWLGRNTNKIHEKGVKKSFVTVWTTLKEPDPADDLLKKNSDAILALWNDGVVENVYLDLEGTQKANDKKDFVMFVNADSEEEAKTTLNNLPFVTSEIATYNMYPVGVFWIGEHEEKN